MKKTILITSLLAVFLMLMIPNVNAIEVFQIKEHQKDLIDHQIDKIEERKRNVDVSFPLLKSNGGTLIQVLRIALAFWIFEFGLICSFGLAMVEIMFIISYYLVSLLLIPICLLEGNFDAIIDIYNLLTSFIRNFMPVYYFMLMGLYILEAGGRISFKESYNLAKSKYGYIYDMILSVIWYPGLIEQNRFLDN